jgi:hypothetical protein
MAILACRGTDISGSYRTMATQALAGSSFNDPDASLE